MSNEFQTESDLNKGCWIYVPSQDIAAGVKNIHFSWVTTATYW